MMKGFVELFGRSPELEASAPGRVNLLGEHTDYNNGFVLPVAIPQRTTVQLSKSSDSVCTFYSANIDEIVRFRRHDPFPPGFGTYVAGCIELLSQHGHAIAPVNLLINSTVPIGAGLSSSAALEVAALKGLNRLYRLAIDDVEIARLAQRVEIEYVGLRCGIMDQMACSLADEQHMLFLDTQNLERRLLPLPENSQLLVVDSGMPRRLSESAYNQRRRECEQAAARLGVASLRDINDQALIAHLPEPLNRRARHVISENQRVLDAVAGVNPEKFGVLMNASHASLRDDYEVSIPALDCLAALLQKHPDIYGARLTGAGFGGACVALTRQGLAQKAGVEVLAAYSGQGYQGKILVP